MDNITALCIALPIVATALTIASFFIARAAETRKRGQDDGELKADISYIKRRVDDIVLEQRETTKTLDIHGERITRVEESVKQAHKRIDALGSKGSRGGAAKE